MKIEKQNMKNRQEPQENEPLEMFSAAKLVERLMTLERLTPDQMAEKTGVPVQVIIGITKHVDQITITEEIALRFQRHLGWSATELLDLQINDVMAMYKALLDILKIRGKLLKLGFEIRESEALVEKLDALIEKMFPGP
jgi:plasmid maintenance system antidote protein VapI